MSSPLKVMLANPMDDGPYPSYLVILTGQQVLDLMNHGLIDIDESYQRGKSSPTAKRAAQAVHALKPSRDHIESIKTDLITVTPDYNRNRAIIPEIWLNCRRNEDGSSNLKCYSNPEQPISIGIFSKLYCFDGWHRALSIKSVVRDAQINPGRRFRFMIFDAPLSFEAWAFRVLNSAGMPVAPARVAWVSAPFSHDMFRIAWEFATSNTHLTWEGQYNFETVKSTVSAASPYYASFLSIANGFTTPPNTNIALWPQSEIDPANPKDRRLVVDFMNEYWDRLVSFRPDLGFRSFSQRQASRRERPLLVNNLMMQVLIWMGHEYIRIDCAAHGVHYRDRLAYLAQHPDQYDHLFKTLRNISSPGLFKADSKVFKGLVRSTGTWAKNDFAMRREVFTRLREHLGLMKPHATFPDQIPDVTQTESSSKKKVAT